MDGVPYVLILAPADSAINVPAHQLVHAITRLAHRADREAFALHRAAVLVDELDLHMRAPAGPRAAQSAHPRACRIEAADGAVTANPAGAPRRPTLRAAGGQPNQT